MTKINQIAAADKVGDSRPDINEALKDLDGEPLPVATGGGSPTVDTVQEYIDNTGSSGYFLGGGVSDGGAGTLDVAAGSGFIRTTNDDNAELQSFKWSASAGIAVTDDTCQYIYVDDAGAISLSTDEFLEAPDKILIGVVVDEGGAIVSVYNLGVRLEESIGQAGRFIRRVHGVVRDKSKGGLIVADSGDTNRNISLTAGVLWWGRTEYAIAALDTAVADTFPLYSGATAIDAAATVWTNTVFGDGAGGTTVMTNNRYANIWFYIEPDGHLVGVYGTAEYISLAAAEAEASPAVLPNRITCGSILAAQLTFQKSATSAVVTILYDSLPQGSAASDHGNLSGLLDDDHPQYLKTDGSRDFTGNQNLGENVVILDNALSADEKFSGIAIDGIAGATLAVGDLIYLDPTDSRWELTDANAAAGADGDARSMIGICILAAAADASATRILLQGTIASAAFPAFTVNEPLYVSETAGLMTLTAPTTTDNVVRVLGFALSSTDLYFNPSSDFITHS